MGSLSQEKYKILNSAIINGNCSEFAKVIERSKLSPQQIVNTKNRQNLSLLYIATWYNQEDIVKYILQFKPDLLMKDEKGYTVLHVAANQNYLSIAKWLLQHDQHLLNQVTKDGMSPLFCACFRGHLDIVQLFLKADADVNLKTSAGLTATHTAAEHGHLNILKVLSKQNPLVLTDQVQLQSVISLAANANHEHIVEYLHHIKPSRKGGTNGSDKSHKKSLSCVNEEKKILAAVECGNLETLKETISSSSKNTTKLVNTKNEQDLSLLYLATWKGYQNIVQYLLQQGADISVKDKSGYSVLHIAAKKNNKSIVMSLLQNDVTLLDDASTNGMTALYIASYYGHVDLVNFLLQSGADASIQQEDGLTAVLAAAHRGHLDVVKTIVDAKQDLLHDTTKSQLSALHLSVHAGHADVATYLISKGINVDQKDKQENRALDLAQNETLKKLCKQKSEEHEVVVAIQNNELDHLTKIFHSSKTGSKKLANITNSQKLPLIYIATWQGYEDTVKYLLQFNPDVWIKDESGYSVLHVAAKKNYLSIATLLLEHEKSLLHDCTAEGMTPLYVASYYGHIKMVMLFLKNGADVHLKSKAGFTSAHIAVIKGHESVVKAILEAKPDIINETTKQQQSLLHLAVKDDHKSIAKYILGNGIERELKDQYDQLAIDLAQDEEMRRIVINEWISTTRIREATDHNKFDVMLSYQWDNQKFVKELKSFMEVEGLTVWIDVEQMHGSIIERMQEAILNSSVIILCMTRKYEESKNCKLEYSYAYSKDKPMIPIKLENFCPKGELEIYTLNQIYYSFANDDEIETSKKELLKAIQRKLNSKSS